VDHFVRIAGFTVALACAVPSHASEAVATLEVVGQISPRCSINLQSGNIGQALTDAPGSERVGFSVDCNQRLSVNLHSLNGGFLHESGHPTSASPAFISFLPYTATFQVAASGASPISFRSDQMVAGTGATGSIGIAPFKAQGELILNWSPEKPLLGGAYSDVIEIRVSGEGETNSSPS
jgi:hypothetical protein